MMKVTYEEIIQKIEEKGILKQEIEERITQKMSALSGLVSREGAAHILANEVGVQVFDPKKREVKIKDLMIGLRGVEFCAKVLQLYEPHSFKTQNREGRLQSMVVADETESIRVVVWEEDLIRKLIHCKEGDIVRLKESYVRESRNGFREVHLGRGAAIEINPEGITIDTVIQSLQPSKPKEKKLDLITPGETIRVKGTIVQAFEPRFYDACPECNKKVGIEEGKPYCETHGAVAQNKVPVFNFFFDDGNACLRSVAFREIAKGLLNLNGSVNPEEVIAGFSQTKSELLGKQLEVVGRVTKNEMFDRTELIINEAKPIDPLQEARRLMQDAS